jgi:radical SAM superfamily enzyme YgiQ (UPF0313 family)
MKILLINICLRPNSEKMIFPIGFGYIATAIERAGFDFEILDLDVLRWPDDKIEGYIRKADFDVAAFGCIVTGYRYVKRLAEMIKKYKDAPIIVGNSVATSIPEILLRKTRADIGVMGEGDVTIVELLKAIETGMALEEVNGIFFQKNGKLIFTAERKIIPNLDELPFINYKLFDIGSYLDKGRYNVSEPYPIEFDSLRAMLVNTARGCLFRCTFCYHVFNNKRYRARSIESIGKEIKLLQKTYGVNYIQFSDELTLYSKPQADRFADYFLEQGIDIFWAAECRAGLFKDNDLDLALKLKKAGCVEMGYSLESADEEILKSMNKKMSVQDFVTQTQVLHKAGITTSTSLVIGYPQETEETIEKTFNCCYENDIYPSVGYLLPQPGTPMYEYAVKTGKIKDIEEYLLRIGDRQDFHINLTSMPQEEIERLVKYHLRRIADKKNLRLEEAKLIKTGHYIQERK